MLHVSWFLWFTRVPSVATMEQMTDSIEYRFHEANGRSRDAFLDIATTKTVVDYVTSGRGAMLDELREPPTRRVLLRNYGNNGDVLLRFGIGALGQGWSDPRINVTLMSGDRADSIHGFGVSFECPTDDNVALANTIQSGMWKAASLLRLHRNQRDDHDAISATFNPEKGFALRTDGPHSMPTLTSIQGQEENGERIELWGRYGANAHSTREAHARLVAFTGIVAALGPIKLAD